MQKIGTIETVLFKTKAEYSREQVIEAATAVNSVVDNFDGFIARKLAWSDENQSWIDIVYWSDKASAEYAAKEAMKSPVCQPFFQMIDESSMQFMHYNPVIDIVKKEN